MGDAYDYSLPVDARVIQLLNGPLVCLAFSFLLLLHSALLTNGRIHFTVAKKYYDIIFIRNIDAVMSDKSTKPMNVICGNVMLR